MSTSYGSANPIYPFNWLDAVRASAWDPPNLPLFSPRLRTVRLDAAPARRFGQPIPMDAIIEHPRVTPPAPPVDAPAVWGGGVALAQPRGGEAVGPLSWLDAVRATAWDPPKLPLYGPRAAPTTWDSFPIAQSTTEDPGRRAPPQVDLTQGAAPVKAAGPGLLATAAEAAPRGIADATNESVPSDIAAKAIPGGLARGAIGFAAASADTNQLSKTLGSKIGDVLGVSPETQSKIGAAYDLAAKTGLLGPLSSLGTVTPTSDTIKSAVEEKIGPLPEARTAPGQYVQTGVEFLPALLGNKGSLIRGLATNVAVPAIVSETAGQLTKGTAAEPYMRMLGALTGGLAGAKLGDVPANARFARTASRASRSGNVDDVTDVVPPIAREPSPVRREPFPTDEIVPEDSTEHLPHPYSARAFDRRLEYSNDPRLSSINPETSGDSIYERPRRDAPFATQEPLASESNSRAEGGEGRISRPAIRTERPMLFDYGPRMDEWLDVPQFDIERHRSAGDVPARVRELDTPENQARDAEFAKLGRELGVTSTSIFGNSIRCLLMSLARRKVMRSSGY